MGATTIAPVSAPFYFATALSDGFVVPQGHATVDFGSNTARLIGSGAGSALADVQMTGVDGGGRSQVYVEGVEPSGPGSALVYIHVPLTVTSSITTEGPIAVTDNSYEGSTAPSPTGLLITWNLSDGLGETDFINAGGNTGAYRWFNGAGGEDYDKTSIPLMELDADGNLATEGSLIAQGQLPAQLPGSSILLGYDPAGVDGAGTGGLVVVANAGKGAPMFVLLCQPEDGTGTITYLTCNLDSTGTPQLLVNVNMVCDGDVVIGGNLSAERADFTGCFVNGSEVLTAADLPPGGIPYPPAGIGVSTGSAWEEDSIDPATIAYMNAMNQGKLKAYAGTGEALDITASHTAMGCGIGAPTVPIFSLVNASEPTNQKVWTMQGKPGYLGFSAENDTGGDFFWMKVFRTGTDLTGVTITPPLTVDGDATFQGDATFAGAVTAMGNVQLGAPSTATATVPLVASDGANLFLDAFAGAVYLNWDHGTGVNFGNGAEAIVGSVDSAGNAHFNGTVTTSAVLSVTGTGNVSVGALNLDFLGGNTGRILSISPTGSTPPDFVIAVLDANSTNYAEILHYTVANDTILFRPNVDISQNLTVHQTITSQNGLTVNGAIVEIGNSGLHTTGGVVADGGFFTSGPKAFAVPHPLMKDKDLFHSCLEGPENGVFYRGEAVTRHGRAEVMLPTYFEALTFDDERSVLLTQITESDDEPMALLAATRIIDGIFWIRSSEDVRVAWEVKAVRRIGVERLDVVRERA